MKHFYSHGKLLLTGEYVVLDGALSLAIPTKLGQNLKVEDNTFGELHWISIDENGQVWFEDTFKIQTNGTLKQLQNGNSISNRLLQVLNTAKKLNPDFLADEKGYKVTTQLEFPKIWGLGTSSTLINNISNWANINPYTLLDLSFSGSGYDIACAEANEPITYKINQDAILNQVQDDNKREIKTVDFNPSFKNDLYFVHLNQKQNSREGIAQYRANTSGLSDDIKNINQITRDMIDCDLLEDFQKLIDRHEQIISNIIKQKPVKKRLFKDFNGSIKSLGAWGGDFVLAASKDDPKTYFKGKGFSTIIAFNDMILK
ncbi:GYDIA family GHMP kinase [Psychroserpens ponticola]|uniref:GYDIA family GHMP kinase n=1 Tax=Psychroserpens ponticola TaxID=2932268 RepID=A0ABY7RVR1_9FLAO|nr:GYDIA family GHMP kinase [Psychroserpens ponticola]WCO01182.1 GYDIA family GHMP kinase [Psychroserpens ponticola]